jgi:hypothetical protein
MSRIRRLAIAAGATVLLVTALMGLSAAPRMQLGRPASLSAWSVKHGAGGAPALSHPTRTQPRQRRGR